MRLAGIEIRDYRSIFGDEHQETVRLELATGINALVGRNNCGKSNVLRAISLALDPQHDFDPETDIPGPRQFAHPIVVLEFETDGEGREEEDLLNAAKAYEREVAPGEPHHAGQGRVVFEVSFPPDPDGGYWRRELLRTPSGAVPKTDPQRERLAEAIRLLRVAVRFVLVRSGETIESILEGNFREIHYSVVRDRLDRLLAEAERSRETYVSGIQENLLRPLQDRLAEDITDVFPEIDRVTLAPDVQSLEETLSKVEISLQDLVETSLGEKGTGVRGGVVVAMFDYLARNATRGMVFAVEEPEAFLHPGAQEDLRDQLQQLAPTTDVTVVYTTHSPFMVPRTAESKVFCLYKGPEGRTRLGRAAPGNTPHAQLLGDLFRERTFEDLLAYASTVPEGTKAMLIVEGEGDEGCLRKAAALVGRPDLLDAIDIRPAGGAFKLAHQAIITRAAVESVGVPILVLLDNDEMGRASGKLLADKFWFHKKSQILNYSLVFPEQHRDFPWEAEDLFDPSVIAGFVQHHGDVVYDGAKKRYDGEFHYDLTKEAKELLGEYLDQHVRAEHVELWLTMILLIRKHAGLPDIPETVADLIADAPPPPMVSQPTGGLVFVTAGDLDLARYELANVLLLVPEVTLSRSTTHVAFYADGEIKPLVPEILGTYPNIILSDETVSQLKFSGSDPEVKTAAAIEAVLEGADGLVGTNRQVVLLSAPDDDKTFVLAQPVENTKQRDGRPVAWTVDHKTTRFDSLVKQPATTDELDALDKAAGS